MRQPTLTDLEGLARKAGSILVESFGKYRRVHKKGVIDIVPEVDLRSEEFLLDAIRCNFPEHHVITEESSGIDGDEEQCWYIDPLDGTVNYTHGVPIFAVSLAYVESGSVSLGVVYNPILNECFKAERGKGAWFNGKIIGVSLTSDLNRSLLVTGFPYDIRTNPENNLDHYNRFAMLTQGVRRLGSAAIDLCYVAAGRFDGYWEIRLEPWDLAAGALIVQEAGGVVTDINGHPGLFKPPHSILAANPQVYSKMLNVLEHGG
jgi:myo-inositol-1(or 4)-monophosphatase